MDPGSNERAAWFERAAGKLASGYTIVDGGAHAVEGEQEVYAALAALPFAQVVGFEPNVDECRRLNLAARGTRRRYVAAALGDGRPGSFHSCRYPLTSSLLRPNAPLIARYENLASLCEVLRVDPIDTVRLDDIDSLAAVDFLKLDVQGASHAVLAGAPRLLATAPVVHVEVEFARIYENEPLFSEIELLLRQHGYMFHHFHSMEGRRAVAGSVIAGDAAVQMLWADAVFVPGFERIEALGAEALLKLAMAMDLVYASFDLAAACLALRGGDHLRDSYLAMLSSLGVTITR